MSFIVDEYDVVHHGYCQMILESSTPYNNGATTNEEMLAVLARPDVANNHSRPHTQLAPCDQCILGLPVDEG